MLNNYIKNIYDAASFTAYKKKKHFFLLFILRRLCSLLNEIKQNLRRVCCCCLEHSVLLKANKPFGVIEEKTEKIAFEMYHK